MGERQKIDILSNELIRRLSNVGEGIMIQEILGIIDQFTRQLKNSGYERKQIREIVICGLRGFKNKVKKRKELGDNFYRLAS